MKITRKETRKHLEQFELACELTKLIRHFFPDLMPLLRQLPDPGNQSYITYPGRILLMTRILSSLFYISSMRKTSEEFNSDTVIENVWWLCGEEPAVDELPYWETVNRYLKRLDPCYKEGSIPGIAKEYRALKKQERNRCETVSENGKTWYDYVTDIDYSGYGINLVEYGEIREHEYKKGKKKGNTEMVRKVFWYVTDLPVNGKQAEDVAMRGRMRWKIENEGFNTQKRQGYYLEHLFSRNYQALKNHYYLIQIGHMIAQVMEMW